AGLRDLELAEFELRKATGSGARAAADAAASAIRFTGQRRKLVGADEVAAQAETTIAAGVDFKLGPDRSAIGQLDGGFDDGSTVLEFEGKHLARASVVVAFWLVQSERFAVRVHLDYEAAKETGAQHASALKARAALIRGEGRHAARFPRSAGK